MWCRTASVSLNAGAIAPWAKTGNTSPYYAQTLQAVCKHYGVSMSTPWDDLPEAVRHAMLFGTEQGGDHLCL